MAREVVSGFDLPRARARLLRVVAQVSQEPALPHRSSSSHDWKRYWNAESPVFFTATWRNPKLGPKRGAGGEPARSVRSAVPVERVTTPPPPPGGSGGAEKALQAPRDWL